MRLVCIAGYFLNVSFKDLACNMSPGLDSVSAEHMEFAGPKLCVLMSMVISSIFTQGFIPSSMMESVIVPVMTKAIIVLFVSPMSARRSLKWH